MKRIALLLLLVACGKSSSGKDDAGPQPPAEAAIDAAPDAPTVTPACAAPTSGTTIQFRKIGQVVGGALLATSPPADARLFVLEQRGAIRIFDNEQLLPDPFLDLSADAAGPVVAGGEQGLLGLAFHPQYASNGQLFVFYTRRQANDTTNPLRDVVARCQRSASDPNKADAASCVEVLAIPDFASNHNGGMIEFGADGFLYIGTGDGGQANDPNRNGQAVTDGSPNANTQAWLGKMLRIDVDHKLAGQEYGIPTDNPFAAGGGKPEIFQLGLRNPWRWSFDRATGDMWIADVGQGTIEEVDVVKAADLKGKNFGWSQFEGSNAFNGPSDQTGKTFPQDERPHATGWVAIIGGQVYRGSCFPDLVGTYFYADNGGRKYAKATLNGDGTITATDLVIANAPGGPASLHADSRGELYLTTTGGVVFHLEATP